MSDETQKYSLGLIGLHVADHIPAMLAYWDKDLVCRFANAAYLEWFGKDRESMIDKVTIRELLGPLYEKNAPYIRGALEGKKQVFERQITTPSGEVRHSLATYVPDVFHGEVRGFFVHVADISPVKKLEEKLMQTNLIVNEQNKRLLNFANIVSHNLRSYANNFSVLIKMAEQEENADGKATLFRHLNSVSQSFTNTIINLDEVVHAENTSSLKAEVVSIREYIEKAVQILQPNIHSTGAVVVNEADPSLSLELNAAYLESILVNLLSNALKYRHPKRPPVIRFTTFSNDLEDGFRIEDNGLGIDLARFRNDLFGMYKTFHGNADATGIGLFITRFQVEAMRGTIGATSRIGEGTVFTVSFPKP